jgi:hypothetical protein
LSRSEEERLEDLPVEAGSERGEAGKLNLLKKLHGGAFAVDVVALNVAVHESDWAKRKEERSQLQIDRATGENTLREKGLLPWMPSASKRADIRLIGWKKVVWVGLLRQEEYKLEKEEEGRTSSERNSGEDELQVINPLSSLKQN